MHKSKKYFAIIFTLTFFTTGFSNLSAFAKEVSIKSLKRNGTERNLCITKTNNNIRYKKCDGKSPQKFEISGPNQNFKIKRKGKCIVAKINGDLGKVRSNINRNVKIRLGDCNPSNKDVLDTGTIDGRIYTRWTLDRGNRLRVVNSIGKLDICLADGDKNDRIKATDCSNNNNPGRWKTISAN